MTNLRFLRIASLLVPLTGACAAGIDDGAPVTDDVDIVGGQRSGPADDAVVFINGASQCTGVLVSPSVVLTALHCVSEGVRTASANCSSTATPMGKTFAPKQLRVSVGSTIYSFTHYPVKSIITGTSRQMCNGDVAALVLERPVEGVTPLAVRTKALAVGQQLTAIGWGSTGQGLLDYRLRRSGIAVLDTGGGLTQRKLADGRSMFVTSGSKEIVTAEGLCSGDSGGPLIDSQGKVAALVSRSQRTSCIGEVLTVHSDVSYFADLIADARAKQ